MGNPAGSFRCVTVFMTSFAVSSATWVPVRGPHGLFLTAGSRWRAPKQPIPASGSGRPFPGSPDAEPFSAAASPGRMFARSLPEPVGPTPESARGYFLFPRPDRPVLHGLSGIDGQSALSPQRSSVFSSLFRERGIFHGHILSGKGYCVKSYQKKCHFILHRTI